MSNISRTLKKLPRTFWVANSIELIEQWAWYVIFLVGLGAAFLLWIYNRFIIKEAAY